MTALFESLSLMIICDVFFLSNLTFLHFSQVRKPILDSLVDNENSSQSQITYMVGVLYTFRGHSHQNGDIRSAEKEHSKAMSTWMGNSGMWSQVGTRGKNYTMHRNNKVGTCWHLSSSVKLGSGNLRSWREAMNVMLWGLTIPRWS